MSDVTIGAKLQLEGGAEATTTVKGFREQLKQAQFDVVALSEKFGATSKEAAAAAVKAANLKDAIGDAKSLVDAFNPDTKFKAFGATINTVVGGFTALQGVLALTGTKSKEVESAMLKVQAALALSQGFAQLQEGVQTFKNLSSVIQQTTIFQKANAVATNLAAGAMRLLGISANTASTGFQVLKGAIAATGIGLLVIAVATLVSKLSDWIGKTDEAEEAQKRLNFALQEQQELLDRELKGLDFSTRARIARAKIAGESEEKIKAIEEQSSQERIAALKNTADNLQKIAKDSDGRKLEDQEAANKASLTAYRAYLDALSSQDVKYLESQASTIEEARKKADSLREKYDREAIEARKKLLAQAEKDADNRAANFAAKRFGQRVEIPKTAEQLQREAEIATLAEKRQAEEAYYAQSTDLSDRYTKTKEESAKTNKEIAELEAKAEQDKVDAIGNALNALSEIAGENTAAGKVLAIATATINTYKGVSEALASAPPPFNFISAAAVGAAGIANVVKILKVKVPGKGDKGSAPNIAVDAPLTPVKPTQGTTQLDQKSLNAIGNASMRAFVLETDIDTNGERTRRLNRAARIGG